MPCEPIAPACFAITREEHLNQVLPPAGAYTNQAFFEYPSPAGFESGVHGITFWITYTPNGAGGAPAFRLEGTNDTEEARQLIQDDGSLVVAQPEGTVNVLQETVLGPISPITTVYKLPYNVDPGETGVRLLAAEVGNIAAPGDIVIAITGRGGC